MDLWLVDFILCGRKVNLGFLIVQHIANVLVSAHNVLPYGMLLTTIFQHFEIDLDGETNIHICKPSDAIDQSSISRLGYELERNQWVLKTSRIPIATEDESNEEATMDIPPPSYSFIHYWCWLFSCPIWLCQCLLESIWAPWHRLSWCSTNAPWPLRGYAHTYRRLPCISRGERLALIWAYGTIVWDVPVHACSFSTTSSIVVFILLVSVFLVGFYF